MPSARKVVVFGGTGMLGSRIVRRLSAAGVPVRVAVRHPERVETLSGPVEAVAADIRAVTRDAPALAGASGVVNAVGLYTEQGDATFEAVHAEGAARLASAAREAGIDRLVHVSGIGADPASADAYIAARGRGEEAVRRAHPGAVVVRPSALFADGEGLVETLAGIIRRAPVFPLFGTGRTRLQPVDADDVAEAICRLLEPERATEPVYELGGPWVVTYRELVELVAARLGRRRVLMPVPFAAWSAAARLLAVVSRAPPLTPAQVALMREDNVCDPQRPSFDALGMSPAALDSVLDRLAPG
ncbi:MAG: complex I NDUFA9 subunit family protein [Azospirillaceae bacterium]